MKIGIYSTDIGYINRIIHCRAPHRHRHQSVGSKVKQPVENGYHIIIVIIIIDPTPIARSKPAISVVVGSGEERPDAVDDDNLMVAPNSTAPTLVSSSIRRCPKDKIEDTRFGTVKETS